MNYFPIFILALSVFGCVCRAASISCSSHSIPVPADLLLTFHMTGTLCIPDGSSGITFVLVPGATYNQNYWNFSFAGNDFYNFRLAMNNHGYATFVVDRLGTGLSPRPLSLLITSSLQASALHTVIQQLKSGNIGGFHPTKVIIGGHSLGSIESHLEVDSFHDVDAVLLTGFAHGIPLGAVNIIASSYPCPLDPITSLNGCDVGYLTTDPGAREGLFYYPDTTDPAVVAHDEATKDVFSLTEAPDGIALGTLLPTSITINVPVLHVIGSKDFIFCSITDTNNCADDETVRAAEAPFYPHCPDFQAYVLPNSGHDVNLATNTALYHQRVIAWVQSLF